MKSNGGDVAIIGMACIFPRAPNVRTFWQNILSKVDCISDPPDAWGADEVFDPESTANDRIYCKRGGFLGDLAQFDPSRYGIMPKTIAGSDPDQFLALEVASEALRDAGYLERPFTRERTSIILGRANQMSRGHVTGLQHGFILDQTAQILRRLHPQCPEEEIQRIRQELKSHLPPFNSETAPGLIPNVVSGLVANRLDLQGASYTVDAACASSLIAIDQAVQDLLGHRCDMALAGGVQSETPAPFFMVFCNLGALSRTGQIRPFDKDADGTLLGEGVGMVVLKRQEDAERDNDRIYALIKGIGVASDGRGKAVLVPRVEGQSLALRRAYESAKIDPGTVGLIEAHGTGTVVGDLAEIQSMTQVFGFRNGSFPSCAIGSVKSMISHAIPAAGVAGVIKTALALYHRILPPTLNYEGPNPKFQLDKTPFYVNTETRPWIHGSAVPRRAGVNAFGFGGINAHVILEEHIGKKR